MEIMRNYPEVILAVLIIILFVAGFFLLALVEYVKERRTLSKNTIPENIKEQEAPDNNNKDKTGNEDMAPQADTAIGFDMAEFPQMKSDTGEKEE